MAFSKITTMAAAALLAVLFLGTSITHAAPVPESTVDGATYTVGKTVGAAVGGVVDPIAPALVEGALDGDRAFQYGDGPVYEPDQDPVDILLYNVGDTAGTVTSATVPDDLSAGGVDGVTQATGKD
ncbi:hypothetical protein EC991_009076 [Linnemannia zychae]|nr:hypothetical protein EC991_009076 [Linnemannia zychae]